MRVTVAVFPRVERRLRDEASPRLQHEDERRNAESVPEAGDDDRHAGEPDVTTPCGETPATPGLVEDHVT
jgi:hypothetical protein